MTNFIFNDSYFNKKNIEKLENNKIYKVLVLNFVFIFKKTPDFTEKLVQTIEDTKSFGIRTILTSLWGINYKNELKIIEKAKKTAYPKISVDREQIGWIDLDNNTCTLIDLLERRDRDVASNLILNRYLNNQSLEEPNIFRKKNSEEMAVNAKKFISNKVVNKKFIDFSSNDFPSVGLEFYAAHNYIECGYGRSTKYSLAENIAYLEAVERYASMYYPYETKAVYGSFEKLEYAIHPEKFILPTSFENPYQSFKQDLDIYWTKAESLRFNAERLVPEQLVVFGDSFFREANLQNRFIYDSSNGAALGGTYLEAVLFGLLELIERDNFLTAWYGKIPVKKIDIKSMDIDSDIMNTIMDMESDGIKISLYDNSMELKVPSFWASVINEAEGSTMFSYNAAGCHPVAEKAAQSALLEALVGIQVHNDINKNKKPTKIDKVVKFEDHVNYYSDSSSKKAYDFLGDSVKGLPYNESNYRNHDLNIESYLSCLVNDILNKYEDIFVVNLTSNQMEEQGLYVVKVLVPGMLPMTFGEQNERVSLKRINKERTRRKMNEITKINCNPHPFP
ncbi:YcaO-like family protein [Carnobacterium divergens]|uniref:YcaO-like family protein n=1 Tax=Carnobacterium divergens TaxID=2748 RepID=A0AAW8RE17_CARDV|nr:YcaO-like family protein [Carnobacterium divergens]MDT1959066.1 YcaO-like family protein [Carnobacterium divergens]MDT1975175.1 YcaO-like family protein [Carnobacterium divergens]